MQSDEYDLDALRERHLNAARRVVIKVGTSIVTGTRGEFCAERMEPMVRSVARLMKAGRQVVLVSSGAIGLGRGWLGLNHSGLHDLVTKQACAAVGQSLLMDAYKKLCSAWDVKVAQILLTEEDFSDWRRYSNLRRTMDKLLGFRILPIVNQNDTVSTAEIETIPDRTRTAAFSDNDRLAALVMSGLGAEALVLLTNVDGLLQRGTSGTVAHIHRESRSEVIWLVDGITKELKALAAGPSANGRGGMVTKLEAAQIAMDCGGIALIANGQEREILDRIFAGERIGTAFLPSKRIRGKRRWIAHAADVRGRVIVDWGAQQAITQGKASLLVSGVVRIESHFAPMDVVSIVDRDGCEFARGIANCASHETEQFLRRRTSDSVEGRQCVSSPIVVRRDNIVLLQKS